MFDENSKTFVHLYKQSGYQLLKQIIIIYSSFVNCLITMYSDLLKGVA